MIIIKPVRILTKCNNCNLDNLDNLNSLINKFNNLNHFNNSKSYQNEKFKFKTCIATLISYKNDYYVMTCYHVIQDNVEIYIYIELSNEVLKCKMKEIHSIKPYDFSVLEFDNDRDKLKIKEYHSKISNKFKIITDFSSIKKNKKFVINYLSDKTEEDEQDNLLDNNNLEKRVSSKMIECKYINYDISNIKSEMYPKIPIIKIRIRDTVSNYEGLSGSILCNTNINSDSNSNSNINLKTQGVYGMISYSKSENIFIAIPSYCLKLFFKMSLRKEQIKSFCFKTKVGDFDYKNKERNVHSILTGHRILYKTDTDNQHTQFTKSNLIESVDNNLFDDDGDLNFKELNIKVPLDTYVLLKNSKYYNFRYYVKSSGEYVETSKNIYPVVLNEYLKFNLEHGKIIKYKGLIMTEMSEQLLLHYYKSGIKISGRISDHYDDCFSNKQKLVVVIGIDQNTLEKYEILGLPLIKNNKIYSISIVSKINDKKIMSLSDIENSKSSTTVRLEFLCDKVITLNFDDSDNLFYG